MKSITMERITNTQYLKKGAITNVGVVNIIHDNKSFTTTEGWFYNLDETIVVITNNGNRFFKK